MIACISAHAAVNKACDLLGIKLVHVPMNPDTFKVNICAVKCAIGPNTIMMYGSAPQYAQGVIDDIADMGKLAEKYRIGLHVDCCLGGFVLPFAKKLGYPVPDFDFGVPGVSSMSVDTHKYGYALKGISVVLFRNTSLRQAAYFCYSDWAGGMYTTPTIAGSRSTGIIAQCWASLMTLGEEGYLKHVKEIMETTQKLKRGIEAIPGLRVLGQTQAMVVCFTGVGDVNVYAVVDEMAKRGGWSLGSHQHPACAHLCVTVPHVGFEEQFLNDLRGSVEAVARNPDASKHGSASIYGSTALMPTGPVNDILKMYNDIVLKV
jgi:sphinganine-1-phosphate aldolase